MYSINKNQKNIWAQFKKNLLAYQIGGWSIFYTLIYLICLAKYITLKHLENNPVLAIYSIVVAFYILSRFVFSYFYHPSKGIKLKSKYEPTVTFAIPAKDEEENIRETILKIANVNYPKNKFDIIVVNDGSKDQTLKEIYKARNIAKKMGVSVEVVNWRLNRGKREGMAECVKRTNREIVIFIDSDSFVSPSTPQELVKYFASPQTGAVAGHTFVANADENMLTRMQSARYFISFKAYKASEALFGSVTCCSGCCSAYRRSYIIDFLDEWTNQKFLGTKCTYGDDRSLTNFLLKKGYYTLYAPEAVAYTVVPNSFKTFMKQQLRWKKSWLRESFRASGFIWKTHPFMSLSFYIGFILPIISPFILARALIWYPAMSGRFPTFYILGLFLTATVYGIYNLLYLKDRNWIYGILFVVFYACILVWQLPYAILTIRDGRWGTR